MISGFCNCCKTTFLSQRSAVSSVAAAGDVRGVVRLYFTRVGVLPAPRMSQQVWHAMWVEVERNNFDSVPCPARERQGSAAVSAEWKPPFRYCLCALRFMVRGRPACHFPTDGEILKILFN